MDFFNLPIPVKMETSCSRPCSPSDMDQFGFCKCDREAALIPKVQTLSLIGKMKKLRGELRQMERDYLDLHSMKFIPFLDALGSFDAAISKLEKVANKNQKPKTTMDEITVSLSPDEFVLINNLVLLCNYRKDLRNTVAPLFENQNPFFLPKLISKLQGHITNANLSEKICDPEEIF